MSEASDSEEQRSKGFGAALVAVFIFVGLGALMLPGLAVRKPNPAAAAAAAGASNAPVPAAGVLETRAVDVPQSASPLRTAAASPRTSPRASSSSGIASGIAMGDGHTFDCMIRPNELVEIRSAVSGRIDEIGVERGDAVKAGQVLAQLESSVERTAVRVAKANAERQGELESSQASVELGENRRDRAFELFESNSLSLEVRETAETEARLAAGRLKQAEENHRLAALQLEQAKAALELRTIRSPVSGFVIERLMSEGEVVDEETILRVAQVNPLRVEVILPAKLFGQVRPGATAEIVPEAPLDTPRSAQVAIVDPIIDGASATFGAVLHLPNPDHDLPAGLRCQVSFAK